MKFWPSTLLWRTFLLVAALMVLSMLAWFEIYSVYQNEPRARQLTELMESVTNLTRSALINAHPERRRELLRELSDREGIHVYAVEKNEVVAPLPDRQLLADVLADLKRKLGPKTRMTLERNGERAVFVSFHIDGDEYWVALPSQRLEQKIPWQWLGWGGAALALSLAGAYLIMFRVTRPLKALSTAASEIGRGKMPQPVEERGPGEIATLAHAFNQMTTDLARLDSDRALILAGISHDLRTPLARLRMGIEMSGAEATIQEGMVADVEEMDKTIDQFLDFARESSGEALQDTDIKALLAEIAAQYQRRGVAIDSELAVMRPLPIRPRALRRAVTNLIDNALFYAGDREALTLGLRSVRNEIQIDVADRGPGIPAAETERIKLPFTRLDAARGNASGAGLGLAIVERIARGHGGRLELLAREGGGLIARITIPVTASSKPPAKTA